MRTGNDFQGTFTSLEVKVAQGRLVLEGTVRLELPVPRPGSTNPSPRGPDG